MPFFPLLLLSVQNDDDRVFLDTLYRQHCRLMFAAAWKYTTDRDTAEDIVSESIVALLGRIALLRSLDAPALRAYIVTTVRHTAYNHFRKTQQMNRCTMRVSSETVAQLPSPDSPAHDELAQVLRTMHSMPERDQAVLKMKYFFDMDNEEIALTLGLSPESIRQVLSRARKRLKNAMAKEADDA